MNLGAGTSFTVPYIFSSPDIDLAIVSLDKRDSVFADDLVSKGYEPISLSDIGNEPSKEGAEVFTVGFPESTAIIGQISQHPDVSQWSSRDFSLPISSFGRVSMLHDALSFYWVDMSIYPGNSGGPVVEADKIVGIVSGQPTIPVEGDKELETRIPFAKIIKAEFIAELLSIQEQKDTNV
jgi:S1-C subfamily serine protease